MLLHKIMDKVVHLALTLGNCHRPLFQRIKGEVSIGFFPRAGECLTGYLAAISPPRRGPEPLALGLKTSQVTAQGPQSAQVVQSCTTIRMTNRALLLRIISLDGSAK